MICYHTTDAADAILRDGFRDATGSYGFSTWAFTGVWLGDRPWTSTRAPKAIRFFESSSPTMSTSVSTRSSKISRPIANGAYTPR